MATSNLDKVILKVKPQHEEAALEIRTSHKLSPLTARVLAARGLNVGAELHDFLNPELKRQFPDLSKVKGVQAACDLLAANPKARIAICCDYDVDGLTSGTILLETLQRFGYSCVVFVPNRFSDGYGLSASLIEKVQAAGCDLLLTVDYGTTNLKEFDELKSKNIKTIVIDHHQLAERSPDVDAFINPNQADCVLADQQLCAAGLAWCFLCALSKKLKNAWNARSVLDLVALATICDMVPLKGLNRAIATEGIEALTSSSRSGIIALKNVTGVTTVTCSTVGFTIGPRINAAGRMADGAVAIELLSTSDSFKARQLAEKLDRLNQKRQQVEEDIKMSAINMVTSEGPKIPAALVVGDASFHTGVVGIVAQRLVEHFNRPAVVLGVDGDLMKGSVRGIAGFDVVAALKSCEQYLIKFGGHKSAGGCSLKPENLQLFKEQFQKYAEEVLTISDFARQVEADTTANLSEVNKRSVQELQSLAPFGLGHPAPRLLLEKLTLSNYELLKGKHLKISLTSVEEGMTATALMWNTKGLASGLKLGHRVSVIAKPEFNSFRGQTSIQLQLIAISPE